MKRLLAILLSLCLLVPSMGLTLAPSVSADTGYIIAEIPYRLNQLSTGASGGVNHAMTFDPIDLSAYTTFSNGKVADNTVGISYDVYYAGKNAAGQLVTPTTAFSNGQLEITSSGTCDVNEIYIGSGGWMASYGTWKRQVIDLNDFGSCGGDLDVSAINYIRLYCSITYPQEVQHHLIITNVCFVDLTKTPPSTAERPIGETVLTALADPSWAKCQFTSGYESDNILIGYNLKKYATKYASTLGTITDYSPVIQSLLDSLAAEGGGNLYIPEGHYPCRTPINLRPGVSIYGDWKVPDGQSAASGTILDVYYGEGHMNGIPFISLSGTSMVKYLTFWYPEQNVNSLKPYSPTVSLSGSAWAKNCTFINSCMAVKQGPTYVNSPNAQGIYGTPLTCGMDLGYTIDIMRIETVDFAANYWINSGLAGAPSSSADAATLRNHLYQNATGVRMGRIDWSFLTYVTVDGYNKGVDFAIHPSGIPNGQCHNLVLKNCKIGLSVDKLPTAGEMVSASVFENCEYGVLVHPCADSDGSGILQLIDVDITATKYAIYHRQLSMVQLLSSRVHGGKVMADGGWYTIVNTKFNTAAPHIELQTGALSAVLKGNTTSTGGAITVSNLAGCSVSQDNTAANTTVPEFTAEESKEQKKAVAKNFLTIATALDNTGATDVTDALQALLNTHTKFGGTVYLLNGHYRIDGTITIPENVELVGMNDFGRFPYNSGTVLDIYTTGSTPTITIKSNAGIRGLTVWYPKQAHSATFASDHKFTEYPYAIQGDGSNIWIVNIAFRNAYRGVDLMTNKCDNHYVDYLSGACIDNYLQVGGGSENGVIRNTQVKQGTFTSESDMGGWSNESLPSDMSYIVYTHAQNNTTQIRVGHVENQLMYQTFNFGGYQGMQFVGESTGAAEARLIGCAMDYTTVCVDVDQAEKVDILNLQMVSYHNPGIIGPNYSDGSSRLKKTMHFIRLGSANTGTVSVSGLVFWDNPNWCVSVQKGTLNLYGLNYFTTHAPFASMSGAGTLNVVAPFLKRTDLTLASGNHGRVHLTAGYYNSMPSGSSLLGTFKQMVLANKTATGSGGDYTVDFTTGELMFGSGIANAFTNPDDSPGNQAFATAEGITGFGPTTDAAYERYYINMGANARFSDAAHTKYRTTFKVTIKYYDPGTSKGKLVLEYASTDASGNASTARPQVATGTATAGWKTLTYMIEDAKLHRQVLNGHDFRPSLEANCKGWLIAYITVEPLTYGAVDYSGGTGTAINTLATYSDAHAANATYSDPAGGNTALMNNSTPYDGSESFIAKVNYDAAALGVSGSDSVTVLVSYYMAGNTTWNFLSVGPETHQDLPDHYVLRGNIGNGKSLVCDSFPTGKWQVLRCDFTHQVLGGSVSIRTKNYGAKHVYVGRVVVLPTAVLESSAEYATIDFNQTASVDTYFTRSAHPVTTNYETTNAMLVPGSGASITTFDGQNALKFSKSSTVNQTIATVNLSQKVASMKSAGGFRVLIPYYLNNTSSISYDSNYVDTIKIATKNKVITQTMGYGSTDATVTGELAGGNKATGWQVASFHIDNLGDYAVDSFKILSGNQKRDLYIGRIVVIPDAYITSPYADDMAYLDAGISAEYHEYLPSGLGPVANIMAIAAADSGASTTATAVEDSVGVKKHAYTATANKYWYFRVPNFYNDGVNDKTVTVTLKYLAKGGNIQVKYTNTSGSVTTATVAQKTTGKWETATLTVTNALLNNKLTNNADIAISGSNGLVLAFVSITEQPFATEVSFSGAQLVLEENLKVIFYAENPRAQIAAELGYGVDELVCGMKYSFLGSEDVYVTAVDSTQEEAWFEIGNISPDQMVEDFTITPIYLCGNTVVKQGETIQYSIADYLMTLKNYYPELSLALLNYGATLQKYRDSSIPDSQLATAGLTAAEKTTIANMMATVTADSITAPAVTQSGSAELKWDSASLIINNGVKMRFKISPTVDVTNLAVKVTAVGRGEVIDVCDLHYIGNGQYDITTQLPNPEYISDTLQLVLYNKLSGAEVSKTLTYSASAYAKGALTNSDPQLVAFVKAMILYERQVETLIAG